MYSRMSSLRGCRGVFVEKMLLPRLLSYMCCGRFWFSPLDHVAKIIVQVSRSQLCGVSWCQDNFVGAPTDFIVWVPQQEVSWLTLLRSCLASFVSWIPQSKLLCMYHGRLRQVPLLALLHIPRLKLLKLCLLMPHTTLLCARQDCRKGAATVFVINSTRDHCVGTGAEFA